MRDHDRRVIVGHGAERRPTIVSVIATALAGVLAAAAVIAATDAIQKPPSLGQTSAETPVPTSTGVVETPTATIVPPKAGMTEGEAVAIARSAAPHAADWPVRVAVAGPLEVIFTAGGEFEWSRALPPGHWVWQISLGVGDALDSQGAHVFLDFLDGTVYQGINTRG